MEINDERVIKCIIFCYLVIVLVGVSDSLIQSFRLITTGKTFSVMAANLAFAERRSILNADCSLTILYLVCNGRRSFEIVLLDLAYGDVDGDDAVFAGTRNSFFEPILMSNFVVSILFTSGAIFGRFALMVGLVVAVVVVMARLLQIFVRV